LANCSAGQKEAQRWVRTAFGINTVLVFLAYLLLLLSYVCCLAIVSDEAPVQQFTAKKGTIKGWASSLPSARSITYGFNTWVLTHVSLRGSEPPMALVVAQAGSYLTEHVRLLSVMFARLLLLFFGRFECYKRSSEGSSLQTRTRYLVVCILTSCPLTVVF
jgi:hypothetical protein